MSPSITCRHSHTMHTYIHVCSTHVHVCSTHALFICLYFPVSQKFVLNPHTETAFCRDTHIDSYFSIAAARLVCLIIRSSKDSDTTSLTARVYIYHNNNAVCVRHVRVLELPSFSYAYLLESMCGQSTDKKYQLADWRLRPLSLELIKYARYVHSHRCLNLSRIRNA